MPTTSSYRWSDAGLGHSVGTYRNIVRPAMGRLATPGHMGRRGPHPSRRMAPLCGSYGNLDTYKSVCGLNSLIVTTNIPDGG